MAAVALTMYLVFGTIVLGLRVAIQKIRTGRTGVVAIRGVKGRIERAVGVLSLLAMLLGALAPILELLGIVAPLGSASAGAARLAGFALYGLGLAGTFASQLYMGASWRIGVDAAERTALVTGGPFALVRNPIYTALLVGWIGIVLVDPNWVQLLAVATSFSGLELQTRCVEEPHLLRVHGAAYADYAGRVGRFLPALGKLRA